jgi:hypothetical protein
VVLESPTEFGRLVEAEAAIEPLITKMKDRLTYDRKGF